MALPHNLKDYHQLCSSELPQQEWYYAEVQIIMLFHICEIPVAAND